VVIIVLSLERRGRSVSTRMKHEIGTTTGGCSNLLHDAKHRSLPDGQSAQKLENSVHIHLLDGFSQLNRTTSLRQSIRSRADDPDDAEGIPNVAVRSLGDRIEAASARTRRPKKFQSNLHFRDR